MPKEMEEALKKEAIKKGLKGKRKNAYIYGANAPIVIRAISTLL